MLIIVKELAIITIAGRMMQEFVFVLLECLIEMEKRFSPI